MVQRTYNTGEILPRDYGIVTRVVTGKRIFVSPSKYAMGMLMLETPRKIRERIREKAARERARFRELEEELVAGVERREGSRAILNLHGRRVLQRVRQYGRTYFAQVVSKEGTQWYDVQLTLTHEQELGAVRCHCQNNFWNDTKNTEDVCPHAAALELALAVDGQSRCSIADNLTGLFPRERTPLPLAFPFAQRNEEQQRILTDIIFDYFVEGKNHVEINQEVLDNPVLYNEALLQELKAGNRKEFKVLRQREREVDVHHPDRRLYGAIKALEGRIKAELEARGFARAGYGLEFKGTPYQVVSQRFVHHDVVYALCIREGLLPILVKRNLGEKAANVLASKDVRNDHPFARVGQQYLSVDDATRRESLTQVIIPGMNERSVIFVPEWLNEKYRREMER